MVGRRGPVQAAFTPVELKELGELADCDVFVDPQDLILNDASRAELEVLKWRDAKKNLDYLTGFAAKSPRGCSRRLAIDFYRSPKELRGTGAVDEVLMERNALSGEAGAQRAVGTGQTETVACGAVFRSVGYRGTPIAGLPFDEGSWTVPNDGGRVLAADGTPLGGVYCAGWIKRGPTGVIGTNKKDASETVERLISDARAGTLGHGEAASAIDALLAQRSVPVVTQEGWEAIDAAERSAGEPHGRPRVKLAEWDALLEAAGLEQAAS